MMCMMFYITLHNRAKGSLFSVLKIYFFVCHLFSLVSFNGKRDSFFIHLRLAEIYFDKVNVEILASALTTFHC